MTAREALNRSMKPMPKHPTAADLAAAELVLSMVAPGSWALAWANTIKLWASLPESLAQ